MGSKYIPDALMATIILRCGSLGKFADEMEMPYDTIYSKFAGRSDWKIDEAFRAAEILGMNLNEFSSLVIKK